MTPCLTECVKPSTVNAHCTCCHKTFRSASGFDTHRKRGKCVDPSTLGFEPDKSGIWRRPMPEGVTSRF